MQGVDTVSLTARLARAPLGPLRVATTGQLGRLEIPAWTLERLTDEGWMVREHRGVYRWGVEDPWTRAAAGWLAGGGTVAWWSAAPLLGIREALDGPAHLLVDRSVARRPRDGLALHRSVPLLPAEVSQLHGLPCTSAARTLLDLAPMTGAGSSRMADEAQVAHLLSTSVLERLTALRRAHPGRRAVEQLLEEHLIGTRVTWSVFEERLLAELDRRALPRGHHNADLGALGIADVVWPAARVILEADGVIHRQAARRDRDHGRDADRQLAGYLVLRVTWRRLCREPDRVCDEVRRGLALRGVE